MIRTIVQSSEGSVVVLDTSGDPLPNLQGPRRSVIPLLRREDLKGVEFFIGTWPSKLTTCTKEQFFSPNWDGELNFQEYQEKAMRLAIYPGVGANLTYPVLGLAGEAGEVANTVKKIFRDSDGKISSETRERIKCELGDTLWYIAAVAYELGANLQTIAESNLEKLESRKLRGVLGGSGDER